MKDQENGNGLSLRAKIRVVVLLLVLSSVGYSILTVWGQFHGATRNLFNSVVRDFRSGYELTNSDLDVIDRRSYDRYWIPGPNENNTLVAFSDNAPSDLNQQLTSIDVVRVASDVISLVKPVAIAEDLSCIVAVVGASNVVIFSSHINNTFGRHPDDSGE